MKEYLESANAKRNPEFAQYISDALSDYRRAGLLWNIKATLPSGDYVWEDNDGGLWVEFVKAYPDGVRLLQTSKYVGAGEIYVILVYAFIHLGTGKSKDRQGKWFNGR